MSALTRDAKFSPGVLGGDLGPGPRSSGPTQEAPSQGPWPREPQALTPSSATAPSHSPPLPHGCLQGHARSHPDLGPS